MGPVQKFIFQYVCKSFLSKYLELGLLSTNIKCTFFSAPPKCTLIPGSVPTLFMAKRSFHKEQKARKPPVSGKPFFYRDFNYLQVGLYNVVNYNDIDRFVMEICQHTLHAKCVEITILNIYT